MGRDVVLVAGAFVARAKSLGWRWPGWAEFFRVHPAAAAAAPAPGSDGSGSGSGDGGSALSAAAPAAGPSAAGGGGAAGGQPAAAAGAAGAAGASGGGGRPARGGPAPAAPLVQPLYISKVNTVLQLGLVGTCMLRAWLGWPGEAAVWAGSGLTAATTIWSSWAYLQAYRQGRVLAPAPPPR